jgi:hypothetical protein
MLMVFRFLLALLVVCGLFACVSQTDNTNQLRNAGTFTTVTDPELIFPASSLFSWSSEKTRVYNDPVFGDLDLNGLLRESIEAEILSRGHNLSDRGGEYHVSYVAALERALSDDEIDSLFGINPGLPSQSPSGQSYDKGTLIIDVSDKTTRRSLWRSAMQGYVTLDISEKERRERIRLLVEKMFRSFPPAK